MMFTAFKNRYILHRHVCVMTKTVTTEASLLPVVQSQLSGHFRSPTEDGKLNYYKRCNTSLYLLLGAHDAKLSPTKKCTGFFRVEFSLLEIDLCLSLILSFNLKHILTNEAVKDDVMGDYFICMEASKGIGVALRPAKSDCFR